MSGYLDAHGVNSNQFKQHMLKHFLGGKSNYKFQAHRFPKHSCQNYVKCLRHIRERKEQVGVGKGISIILSTHAALVLLTHKKLMVVWFTSRYVVMRIRETDKVKRIPRNKMQNKK